jgi:exodeoxyribonuclease VII small subunit
MAKPSKTYQDMAENLADIIAWFESDEINLAAATAKYEEAIKLLNEMETYLKTAENKIHKVTVSHEK